MHLYSNPSSFCDNLLIIFRNLSFQLALGDLIVPFLLLQVVSHHWLIIAHILLLTPMVHVRILTVHGPPTVCWVKCGEVTQGEIFVLMILENYEVDNQQKN